MKCYTSIDSVVAFLLLSQITCLGVFGLFFMGFDNYTVSLFHSLPTLYLGASVSIIGAVIFSAAKLNLGKQYSHCSNMYLPKDIVTNGVYKYIRHPIYTANLLIVFGLFITTGSLLVFAVGFGMTVYYQRSANIEEKYLEITFENYKIYKKSTGRFLPKKTAA